MELSSCPDCHDLADALRKHVKMVREAREYATDAHAGEVRDITPLQALKEQAEYYEDMMDTYEDQEEAINDLESKVEQLEFLLEGTKINLKDAKKQNDIQIKYITKFTNFLESCDCQCQDVAPEKCYWVSQFMKG